MASSNFLNLQSNILDNLLGYNLPASPTNEDRMGYLISSRQGLNQLQNSPQTNSNISLFLQQPILAQLQSLGMNFPSASANPGTGAVFMQYLPYNYWTVAHTNALASLTTIGDTSINTQKLNIAKLVLNAPWVIDTGSSSFLNVWDALTSGASVNDKLTILQGSVLFTSVFAYNTTTNLGLSLLYQDFKTIMDGLVTSDLTKAQRIQLMGTCVLGVGDLLTLWFLEDNSIANLIAFNTAAKQALFESLGMGRTLSAIIQQFEESIKINPNILENIKLKCVGGATGITRVANETTAAITGLAGTRFVLLSCENNGAADISLSLRGLITSALTRYATVSVVFSRNDDVIPGLTSTAVTINGATFPINTWVSPRFAQNSVLTSTLKMFWLLCD